MARSINYQGRRITVPDDFSDDEVAGVLAASPEAPTPGTPAAAMAMVPEGEGPPMAPPVKTGPAPLAQSVGVGFQGMGRGIAELAGLPVDLMSGVLNLGAKGVELTTGREMPRYEGAVGSSAWLRGLGTKAAGAAGVPLVEEGDMTTGQRAGYNVNRFGAQAAGMGAGLATRAAARSSEIAAGNAIGAGAPARAAAGHSFGDTLVRPYMGENIGRTVAGDAAGAVGSGLGVTAAQEYGYDSPLGEMVAALAGGFGGMTGLAALETGGKAAAKAAGRPFGAHLDRSGIPNDPATNLPVTTKVSDIAAKILQHESIDPAAARTRIAENRTDLQGGGLSTMPTPAALSEDVGLQGLQAQIDRQSGNQAKAIDRNQKFSTGVRDQLDKTAPAGATVDPLVARAQAEAAALEGGAQARVDTTQRRAETVANAQRDQGAPLATQVPASVRADASTALDRALIDETYIPARTEKNRLFNETPPDTPIDPTRIQRAAEDVQARFEGVVPSLRQRVIDAPVATELAETPPTTYGQAGPTRMALSDAEAEARRAGRFGAADSNRQLRRAVGEAADEANPAAAQNYRENFAPRFRRGEGDAVTEFTRDVSRDPLRTATPRERTAERFTKRPEDLRSLRETMAGQPAEAEALGAAGTYLRSQFAEAALRPDGMVDPRRAMVWRNRNSAVLREHPEFEAEINAQITASQRGERLAGQAEGQVQGAQAAQRQTQDQIQKGALGTVLRSDPDRIVAEIMSKPNEAGKRFDELVRLTENNPEARAGLKVAVRDFLVDKATTTATEKLVPGDRRGPVSHAKLTNIMNEHERDMAKVFSPEEMNALRTARKALDLSNIERNRTGTGSDTMEKATAPTVDKIMGSSMGKGIEAALRLQYGMLKGGGMVGIAKRALSGVGSGTADDIKRLVERATADPELAMLLLGRKIPIGSPRWNARMNQVLGVGEGARGMSVSDDED